MLFTRRSLMTLQDSNSDNLRNERQKQMDFVSAQLRSQRSSDIWAGMEQITSWAEENSEDPDVYKILLDAVQDNQILRERISNFLLDLSNKGSKAAQSALRELQSSIQGVLAAADDAYYSAQYESAVKLYKQVLKLDPDNLRANDHLAKAEIRQLTGEANNEIPKSALQYYRRARSHIAAKDFGTATNLLNAAIEEAQAQGIGYLDAEETLINVQNLISANDFKQKAILALGQEQWNDALDAYNKALALDPTNDVTQKEIESLKLLLYTQSDLRRRGNLKILAPLHQTQKALTDASKVFNPDNPLLVYVQRQLTQIRLMRTGIILIVLLIGCITAFSLSSELFENIIIGAPTETNTPTITLVMTDTPVEITTESLTQTPLPAKPTSTIIPTLPYTETSAPIPTVAGICIGYIKLALVTAWQEPEQGIAARLGLYQVVTILEKRDVGQFSYFKCSWVIDGITQEGWINSTYIEFGPVPTP